MPLSDVPPVPPTEAAPVPLIAYPSWMDGRYISAVSAARPMQVVTLDPDGMGIIPANSQRYALGIVPATGSAQMTFTPWQLPSEFVFLQTGFTVGTNWYDSLTYGALVQGEWYVRGTAGDRVGFLEVVLL